MIDPQPVLQTTPQPPWWAVPLASGVLTLVTALFGAWWGGKLGVHWEIEKFSQQRAFDHRLEWYVRAIRTIGEIQFRHVDFTRALARKDFPESQRVKEKIADLMPKFDGDIREALLFASPSTVRTLTAMYVRMEQIMSTSMAEAKGKVSGALQTETADDQIRNTLASAYEALSQDVREHLNLEKLTAEDIAAPRTN
jgi:hypothetical protein